MLKDTKKLFISFLEMQKKAVSLRLGNKAFCHNCHSPHMNTSILSCSVLPHHCTTMKETFLSMITAQYQVQCMSDKFQRLQFINI